MGKNLSGKNLEKGMTQRKAGIYSVRFISLSGKRREKHFKDYQDARKWLAKARFEEEAGFTDKGHANLSTTMDRYVHVTEESLAKGMELFESDETERHKSECKLL